jgi:hypothetical protein
LPHTITARPTAPIAQKSLADRLLIVACSAYVGWTWLIEPAAPPFDDALVANLVKLGALIGLRPCFKAAGRLRRNPGHDRPRLIPSWLQQR